MKRKRLFPQEYAEGIIRQDRIILSKAITLIESQLPSDIELARQVMNLIMPYAHQSIRIGITGVPGVGKSTFLETFGKVITQEGKKIAILAIDPSSQVSKGSILGDKTRMESLSQDPLAYIRPSPAGSSLGGVGRKTRETMLLCEAAGFEVILIETVGVGQSETIVHSMTDFFLLLMLAGAGDDLQGIKRGIMEMADAIAITKADSGNEKKAAEAQRQYQLALHLFPPHESSWIAQVLTCSALQQKGIQEIWDLVQKYIRHTQLNGFFGHNREQQNLHWLHETLQQRIWESFYAQDNIKQNIAFFERKVADGVLSPVQAAEELMLLYQKHNE